jgi:hypothetical protein
MRCDQKLHKSAFGFLARLCLLPDSQIECQARVRHSTSAPLQEVDDVSFSPTPEPLRFRQWYSMSAPDVVLFDMLEQQ